METYTSELIIDRPRAVVYDQLQRFEDYPTFMDSAESVERLPGDRLRWRVRFGPVTREYEAEITEERPGELLAWRADTDELREEGEVRLGDVGDGRSLVRFAVSYDLDSLWLRGAEATGLLARKAEQDLQRLKAHLEAA